MPTQTQTVDVSRLVARTRKLTIRVDDDFEFEIFYRCGKYTQKYVAENSSKPIEDFLIPLIVSTNLTITVEEDSGKGKLVEKQVPLPIEKDAFRENLGIDVLMLINDAMMEDQNFPNSRRRMETNGRNGSDSEGSF